MKVKKLLKLLKDLNVDYKLVGNDLVLYPDNYSEDGVYFNFVRFNTNGRVVENLMEYSEGNSYTADKPVEEFLTFVKNFRR